MMCSFLLPGEGRGPVGSGYLAGVARNIIDLRNWAPAFAGEQVALEDMAHG